MNEGAFKTEQTYLNEKYTLYCGMESSDTSDHAGQGMCGAGGIGKPPKKCIRNPLWSQEGTFYHTKESFLILI